MLNNNIVTRFPNGLSNQALDSIFSSVPFPLGLGFHIYDQDFDQYVAGDWTVTETQAGATQALAAGNGGLLLLTNTAANNDVNQIQKNPAAFLPALNKQLVMRCRFQLSDVLASAFAIGLQVVNADGTVLANATDGIFFLKAAGAATVNLYCRKDNTTGSSVASNIVSLVNATTVTLDVYYDGLGRLYYAVNESVIGYIEVSAANLPDTILAPIAVVKNGEAVAKTATIDQIYVALER